MIPNYLNCCMPNNPKTSSHPLIFPSLLQHFLCTTKLDGGIKENSNHLIIVVQILFTHYNERLNGLMILLLFHTAHTTLILSVVKIFHLARFLLVGILSRSFQEKGIFLLSWTLTNVLKYSFSSRLHFSSHTNKLSSFL